MAQLDKMRTVVMHRSAVTIQRHVRGFLVRHQCYRRIQAAICIQVSPPPTPPTVVPQAPSVYASHSGSCWDGVPADK